MLRTSGSIKSDDVSKTGLVLRASVCTEDAAVSKTGVVLRALGSILSVVFLRRALWLELQVT